VARIRQASVADAEALASLSAQLGYPSDAATLQRRLDAIAATDGGIVLVAVDAGDAVAGFAHALPQRFLITDPFVELVALVVAASVRGQGVGAALLRAVEA
jgi:GNAT superfamily N-acetyltransferase